MTAKTALSLLVKFIKYNFFVKKTQIKEISLILQGYTIQDCYKIHQLPMLELLNRYCLDNTKETGLMLLDMPTGTGKTYNVLQFIKSYLRQNQDKKIFFVTTLKKNLDDPYNELLDDLKNEPELCDTVFRVLSNKEHAICKFGEIKKKIRIKEIRFSEEFKSFDALISAGVNNPDAFGDIERNFRYLISRTLSRKFKKKSEKLNAIKNDKDWKWVGELYPVVFSEEKRVFFITMKKLIYPFDTIIEKSARLYETDLFKNSIVFIDEFDATKKDIQDMIVQNGLSKGIDYIDLFRNIKICLDHHESIPSNIWDNVENKPSHKHALEKNIEIFNNITKEHHLLQHHKSSGFEEDRVVLFSDFTHSNYTTGGKDVSVEFNKKKNINALKLTPKGQTDESLYDALNKIKGAISHFARFVAILAWSYRKIKLQNKEEGKSYGEFTEYHAIDTVLDSLHLQGEGYRIIRDIAQTYSNQFTIKSNKSVDLNDDFSFYVSGFSHYDFCDDYSHDNTTIIRKFVFEETPESILYTICSLSKIVGISATATFKTVLGNYDIDYLEWKLGENFVKPSEEEKTRLKTDFESQTSGLEKVDFIIELTNTSASEIPDWSIIYKDSNVINLAHNKTSSNDDKNHYKEVRYFKSVLAYKQFLDNNIQSYLALFSKALKENDPDFDQNILFELFEYLSKENDVPFEKELCTILDSNNFDEKKKDLISSLNKGEKRFVISTYATIGAGQNLQYVIPDNRQNEVVKINDNRNSKKKPEMDFDGIYLDKPTWLVNLLSGEEETAINRVFQMEYLFQNKAISYSDKMAEIVKTYSCINKDKEELKWNGKSFSMLRDVKIYATKTIVQAMGRKCRTNFRGKKVCILADSELCEALDKTTLYSENRLFNREMIELANQFFLNEESIDNRYIEDATNTAISSNKRIRQLLTRCFENSWTDDEIQKWQNMREYVLKHPTLSKEEWKKSPLRQHYIALGKPTNRYYYQQSGDFDKIEQISENSFTNACSVSQEDANLSNLFETWPQLRNMFIEKGYATEFKEGDYIMSPPLYQNIYKGALGEVCGKEIFKHFGIPLEELDEDEHELFDVKVTGKPIYVDFKYWKETSRFDAKKYREKVVEKANKCKEISTILIANVRDTGFDKPITTTQNDIKIIELSLICNSKLSQEAAKKIKELKNE